MADIWSGNILLPDGNSIQDVGLSSRNVTPSIVIPSTTLRLLSTVDTAKIPLYLAAGPSLDVWTTSEATEAWFQSILLSKPAAPTDALNAAATHEWWRLARSQSPIGILVQVENEVEDLQQSRVSEILFYGTIAPTSTGSMPTPPSSSPQLHTGSNGNLPELRVHALPLSSHLLHHQDTEPLTNSEPQFLPPRQKPQSGAASPRRKRDIFEEATIANKKARGRGGKGVAAAAARASESQQPYARPPSRSIDSKTPFPDIRPSSASGVLSRSTARPLSRSPSISSETGPLGRKSGQDTQAKRSNLSRVATTDLQPEEPTTESRNKEALSKVVMAAMRMHGLQQRKKQKLNRSTAGQGAEEGEQLNESTIAEEAAKDDEYKLIYHQTFKGAVLALRKHMNEKPLHAQSDLLRNVVEKLLAIFLTDPLVETLTANVSTDPLVTPGRKAIPIVPGSTRSHASPFDLPSNAKSGTAKLATNSQAYTGSPVSRRKLDTS